MNQYPQGIELHYASLVFELIMSNYASNKKRQIDGKRASTNKQVILMQSCPLIGTRISARASLAMCNMLNQPNVITQQMLNLTYPTPSEAITSRTLQMNYENIIYRESTVHDMMMCLHRNLFIGEKTSKSIRNSDAHEYTQVHEDGCTYLASPTTNAIGKVTNSPLYHYELVGNSSEYSTFNAHCPDYFILRLMLKNIDSDSVQPHYMAVRMFRNELHSRNDDKRRKTTEAELSDTEGKGIEIAASLFSKHASSPSSPLTMKYGNMSEYNDERTSVSHNMDNESQCTNEMYTVEQCEDRGIYYYILPGDGAVPITKLSSAKRVFFTNKGREDLLNHFQQYYSAHGLICTYDACEKVQHSSCMFVPSEILSGKVDENQWNLMTNKDIEAYYHPMVFTKNHHIPSHNGRFGSIQMINIQVSKKNDTNQYVSL